LTIRGQSGGPKPVIVIVPDIVSTYFTNQVTGDLKLDNIQMQNMTTFSEMPWSGWDLMGNQHELQVNNCFFEFSKGQIFNLDYLVYGANIKISNSYFRDLSDLKQWWNARVLLCNVPLDTFIIENNTFTGGGITFLNYNTLHEYTVINHNTFINNIKYPFFNLYWKELYFTNNLFVNVNMTGEDYENVATGGQDPDALLMGIIGLDTITNSIPVQGKFLNPDSTLNDEVDEFSDLIYYAADNVVTYSATLDDYYRGGYNDNPDFDAPESYLTWMGIEGPHQVRNVPGIWTNARTQQLIDDHENIKDERNSIYELMVADLGMGTDPMPQVAADRFAQWNRNKWGVPDVEPPFDMSPLHFGDYDPSTIPGVETENSSSGGITKISDLPEDFSYTAVLRSKSDGLRIGALHWNDEEFDSQFSLEAIKMAYEGHTVVSVEEISEGWGLKLKNYPNPFSSSTVISFDLQESSRLSLVVYDLSGRLVTGLIDEVRPAGTYTVRFYAGDLQPGTYFYRLSTERRSETGKMILMR